MSQLLLPRLLITPKATGLNCNEESETSHLKQIIASDLKNPKCRPYSIYEMELSHNKLCSSRLETQLPMQYFKAPVICFHSSQTDLLWRPVF